MADPRFLHAISFVTRFWLRVWPRGDCWEWRGARHPFGHGQCVVGGEREYVHRIAYVYAKGSIPRGCEIDHICRHPWCVKPTHLEAVPHRTNMLRGNTVAARAAAATHCPAGHAYDEQNTIRRGGHRRCRTCDRACEARRSPRRRAQ